MATSKIKTPSLEDQAKAGVIDLTKTGPLTYRELRAINNNLPEESEANKLLQNRPGSNVFGESASRIRYTNNPDDTYGESSYDAALGDVYDYENRDDIRAEKQPWYAQLGNAVTKGVALAGTTFVDGTLGLLYGAATAISEGRMSGFWDNEVSNTMSQINKQLEEILPNYQSSEEREGPWWKRLGTINFWADGVLKNLGFTVGAFYSGAAWTKALKAIGLVNGALSAKGVGGFLSGFNEGRIEAHDAAEGIMDFHEQELKAAYEQRAQEIENSSLSDTEKALAFADLDRMVEQRRAEAQDMADAAGLTTLIGNTVLLTLDNVAEYGRLYARGFKEAKGLKSNMSKAFEQEALEETGKNLTKKGGKYVWNDITKAQAIRAGVKNGLLEGNEEMSQAFISEFATSKNTPDSPDAYYNALTDEKAILKTLFIPEILNLSLS